MSLIVSNRKFLVKNPNEILQIQPETLVLEQKIEKNIEEKKHMEKIKVRNTYKYILPKFFI